MQLTQRLIRNTLTSIIFLIANKKLIARDPRCKLFHLLIPRTAVTQQHTHKIVMSQLVVCCLWNMVCTIVTSYSFYYTFIQVLLIASFNFNFSSQCILLGLTSRNTSNIMYYTVILCHKLVFLVLVRLIAIKIFNWIAALITTDEQKLSKKWSKHCVM